MNARPRSGRNAWSAFLLFIFVFLIGAAGGCYNSKELPPNCTSGVLDADESDIDCGGKCGKCSGGLKCNVGEDCTSGSCDGVCAAAEGEPTITSFTVNHEKVPVGTPVELTAVFEGGTGEIDNDVGPVESGTSVSTKELSAPTVFTLTVTSDTGVKGVRKVKVEIGDVPIITSFKAAAPAVKPGTATTLTAVFKGGKGTIDNGIGEVTSGQVIPTGPVNENKRYVLTVKNDAGETATETAEVEAAVTPVITSFEAVGGGTVVSRFKKAELKAVFTGGKGTVDKNVGAITSGTAKETAEVGFSGETWTLTVTNGLGESVKKTLATTTKQEIFVADYGQDVLVFDIDDKDDAEPKRILLTDINTQAGVLGLWVDGDEIYVANEGGTPSISVYPLSAGGRPPYGEGEGLSDKVTRQIKGPATGIDGAYMLAIADGEIFVADKTSTIKVWDKTANGNVAPKRTIAGAATGLDNALGVYVSDGELYVANYASAGDTASITVYAQTAKGNAAPKRTIPAVQPTGLVIDGNDLFVTSKTGEITVYNKKTGAQQRKIAGATTGLNELYQCSINNKQLYCADYLTDKVVVFPTSANGNVAPTRTIKGDHTYMVSTSCLFIF